MKTCLLAPLPEAVQAAGLLSAAADAILEGEMSQAADLLRQADLRVLHTYAAYVMSAPPALLGFDKGIRRRKPIVAVEKLAQRMPAGAEEDAIYRRDGYRCRYCGCAVVKRGIRPLLTSLFPEVVQWPGGKGGDLTKHAAFYALNGVLDHVVPYARGGANSADNIVTACWPCNFGKEDHSLEELGLTDPRMRDPVIDDWDGLDRLRRRAVKHSSSSSEPMVAAMNLAAPDVDAWLTQMFPEPPGGTREILSTFLISLEEIADVSLSVGRNLIVNIVRSGRLLSVLGINAEGDVDVPWLIDGEKDWFKPFAKSLSDAIPGATLYETAKMWRVDGGGRAKGQISLNEIIGAAAVIRCGIQRLTDQ